MLNYKGVHGIITKSMVFYTYFEHNKFLAKSGDIYVNKALVQ